MLKVSANKLPLANEQIVQASKNSGSTFQPNNNEIVHITIQPESVPMLDAAGSYITCDFELIGNPTAQFNFNGGSCLSMIQDLRVSLGGRVVEEINSVPVLINAMKTYLRDVNGVKKDTIQESGEGIANPLNQSAAVGLGSRKVQLCFQLPSGVLRMAQGVPLVACGALDIEFRLAPAAQVLKLTSFGLGGLQNPVPAGVGTARTYKLIRSADVAAGATMANAQLAQTGYVAGGADGANTGYYGFNNIDDCPFPVGSIVRIRNTTAGNNTYNAVRVGGLDTQAGGNVRLTFVAVNGGALPNVNNAKAAAADIEICIIGFLNNAGTAAVQVPQGSYQISNVQFHAQKIDPPPQYLNALPQTLSSGGFSFDVPTYQEVQSQNNNLVSATAEIPVYSSRAVSVLTVPRLQAQVNYNVNLNGDYVHLSEYQHQIGQTGRREPSRPVSTSIMDDANRLLPSQEHLRELEKALKPMGAVRSLKDYLNCFVIGRALSAKGGSMNLQGSGCRLYANYLQAPGGNLTYHSFVHHIRTVNVSSEGVVVLS